jgi:hypothetical protein
MAVLDVSACLGCYARMMFVMTKARMRYEDQEPRAHECERGVNSRLEKQRPMHT